MHRLPANINASSQHAPSTNLQASPLKAVPPAYDGGYHRRQSDHANSASDPTRLRTHGLCKSCHAYTVNNGAADFHHTTEAPLPVPPLYSPLADTAMEDTKTLSDGTIELSPRTGTSFFVNKGQRLTVIDPKGVQVSDLVAFNRHDTEEVISNGRTFDYADTIYLTTGHPLYSNRSNVMLRIVEDTCGRHDFLLTPCSKDTFRIIYGDKEPHHGCFGNLSLALSRHDISPDRIPCAFNCFMNVPVDGKTGKFTVDPPISKPGDHIDFVAEMDLIVAITACSAGKSNGGTFKPIRYKVA